MRLLARSRTVSLMSQAIRKRRSGPKRRSTSACAAAASGEVSSIMGGYHTARAWWPTKAPALVHPEKPVAMPAPRTPRVTRTTSQLQADAGSALRTGSDLCELRPSPRRRAQNPSCKRTTMISTHQADFVLLRAKTVKPTSSCATPSRRGAHIGTSEMCSSPKRATTAS